MSQKPKNRYPRGQDSAPQSNTFLVAAISIAAAVVLVAAAFLLFSRGDETGEAPEGYAPEVSGAPNLVLLGAPLIDHGSIQVNQFVDSVFTVQNTGDQVLTLDCDDRPQLVAGC